MMNNVNIVMFLYSIPFNSYELVRFDFVFGRDILLKKRGIKNGIQS